MYRNDPESRVVEFDGVPQCDVGSPSPQIFAYEHGLLLAYLVQRKSGIPLTVPDTYAVVRFVRPLVHIFGWPNDEVLQAHPLYNNGLESYASYEILQSPWIKQLEISNAVHPMHKPGMYANFRHFIFTFHDSTFECIAQSFDVCVLPSRQAVAEAFAGEFKPFW